MEKIQWLAQISVWREFEGETFMRGNRCYFLIMSVYPALSLTPKTHQGTDNNMETSATANKKKAKKNKKTNQNTKYFTASMTHWSVKCIYATANKQIMLTVNRKLCLNISGSWLWPWEAYLTIAEICYWHT